MDFFTDLMGLILLIVCILIVLIFLKDYIRLGGKKTTVNKKQKMIVYEVHQNNKRIQQGWITDDQLPFQFGRNAGSGNDVVVVPEGTPADEAASVSRAWFYIQKDALGNYMCIVQNCPVMVKRDSQRRKNWWLRTAIPGKQCIL